MTLCSTILERIKVTIYIIRSWYSGIWVSLYKINVVTLLPQLMNAAYVKQIISQSFQSIILMIVCLIMYLVATIVGKSGLSIGSVIDTYFLHLYLNVNTKAGSVPLLGYWSKMGWEPRMFYKCLKIQGL